MTTELPTPVNTPAEPAVRRQAGDDRRGSAGAPGAARVGSTQDSISKAVASMAMSTPNVRRFKGPSRSAFPREQSRVGRSICKSGKTR